MLYQPAETKAKPFGRRFLGALGALWSILTQQRADHLYLDGMRPGELEELGLRRAEDRSYQPLR
jgi:hypothetical protein